MKDFVAQEKEEITDFLKSLPIFGALNHHLLQRVADRMQAKRVTKGEGK